MSTSIPNTKTVVSYSYTVLDAQSKAIGTLQGFNPSASRALERVREIMNEVADTKEIVPGRTDFTISLDRLEMYNSGMVKAIGFGSDDIANLTDPITIMEVIRGPQGQTRTIAYQDCWINTWSKTIQEGTITVRESVSLWVTKITIT
jgi:hypothetical protein